MSKPRKQEFKASYTKEWGFIGKHDQFTGYCKVCLCCISISHGGRSDLVTHIKSSKHKINASSSQSGSSQPSITSFVSGSNRNDTITAEVLMVNFLIEHNLPMSVSDHLSDLLKNMFPDSKIAKDFACKRTKSTSISNELGGNAQSIIAEKLKKSFYTISTDGSADWGADEQLYPIVVRYFDLDIGRVITALLQICSNKECQSTGENIFNLMDDCLQSYDVPWKNAICFSPDNAAVMIGVKKGVAAYIRQKQPKIFVLGCVCHLLNIASEKASSKLGFPLDQLIIDIYYFLEKSSKRHKDLKKMQVDCGLADHKFLKHVCTRWLSLEKCIGRLIEQWPAL